MPIVLIGVHAALGTAASFVLDILTFFVSSTDLVTAFTVGVTYLLDLLDLRAGYSPLRLDLVISYLPLTFSDIASPAIALPIPVPLAQCLCQCDTPSCDEKAFHATWTSFSIYCTDMACGLCACAHALPSTKVDWNALGSTGMQATSWYSVSCSVVWVKTSSWMLHHIGRYRRRIASDSSPAIPACP